MEIRINYRYALVKKTFLQTNLIVRIPLQRCAPIDRYVALTRQSIYSIQYNWSSRTNPILIKHIFDLKSFQSVRIACNDCHILLYFTESQQSSIEIYDHQFNQENIFTSLTHQQLPVRSSLEKTSNYRISCSDFPLNVPISSYLDQQSIILLYKYFNCFDRKRKCAHFLLSICHSKENIFTSIRYQHIEFVLYDRSKRLFEYLYNEMSYTSKYFLCSE